MSPPASTLPAPGTDRVLYLIDLSGYVFRAYHAMPPLSSPSGEPTHATLGTLNMLTKLVNDRQPSHMAVAMDSPGKGFRGEIDPDYKANRPPAPPDLPPQMTRCREIVDAYRIPTFRRDGLEADDLIASLTRTALEAGMRVVIASSDKDLMQLVDGDRVWMWDAMRDRVYGPPEVEKKFGVAPSKVRDLLALVGDKSDNITGVPGVGVKTAAKLLDQFDDIDGVVSHTDEVKRPKLRQSLGDHREALLRARELVTLKLIDDLEFDEAALRFGGADSARLRSIFEELQFTRFLQLLDAASDTSGTGAAGAAATPPSEPPAAAADYRTIASEDELTALVARARKTGQLALQAFGPGHEAMRVPLTGIALATGDDDACYLPVGHRYLTAPPQLDLELVRERLGPLLADAGVAKLGHDLKHTQVVLEHSGMPVRGAAFDSMLASYLLDPESSHRLATLATRDARLGWTAYETLAPKQRGKPQLTIEELDIERTTPFAAAHADAVVRLATRYRAELEESQLTPLHDELEIPLLDILTRMELTGVQVEPQLLAELGRQMTDELAQIEKNAFAAAGREFNLASPKQLEAIVFDELGLKSTRKTKTGRSTDHEALEAIAGEHPLPQLVLDHRAIAKLKGTYVDALPKLVHPETGRIHTRWDQAVAATGRLSSKDPNLQNIPIRSAHGKRIREAFTAPDGKLILSADYSQIELRVLAHLSADPVLVEAFNLGQDVHVRTAMEVFGVSQDEVTPEMRAQSKTVNFGVIYGMGPVALSKRLGIARKEAKSFIDAYFERYQGVRSFMHDTLAQAKQEHAVRTLLGRRRMLPDLDSKNRGKSAYAERIAQNTPIQGTAADLLKLAMVKLAEPVVPGARMVLTVHDELVFEVPADAIEEAAAKTRELMESIHPLDVPLVVDVGYGANWAEAH
jgi:DNA polymerase-1